MPGRIEPKEGFVLNLRQGTDDRSKAWASKSELSEKARPLFVCGPARGGTTAFADYLNWHQEILVCQERYKMGAPPERITPAHFTFERILDFRPGETEKPIWKNGRELFVKYHTELLARKDPAKLKWIGDKGPFYVRYMDVLARNNAGARFIVLYRPIEEIIESWESRAKDPDDHWPSDRGTEEAVKVWNTALRKTRSFIKSSSAPRVLIISYHDFFYRNATVVPLISRFLGLEIDESVTRAWREASLEFEGERRRKEQLSEEQLSFVQEHADRAAEAWVLDHIERQWREPGLYLEESG
jgi:Sulfotransferase family